MAVDAVSIWIIKQLGSFAAKPAGKFLSRAILGHPVERALRAPTGAALLTAVDAVLGVKAQEHRGRIIEVLGMFLDDEVTLTPVLPSYERGTITAALRSILEQAVFRAAAPVQGFSGGYLPTSSLTALTDELGVELDPTVFGVVFVDAWMVEVKAAAASTKPELGPLADQLNHERTHSGLERLEARLVELETVALQSAYQQGLREGGHLVAHRYEWFVFHIEPIDKVMNEIDEDYRSGFRATARALRSGVGVEQAMFDLQALQDRRRGARWTTFATAQRHVADGTGGLFGEPIDTLLGEYFKAVRNYQLADESLYDTWYAHYIERFRNLLAMNADPHHRENYSGIAGEHDLKQPTAVALEVILDKGLPERWRAYANAYVNLRSALR